LQKLASRKPSLRKVLQKYSRRERNRAMDAAHKLTTELARRFPDTEHRFERLEKEEMFNGGRNHNRRLAKTDWSTMRSMLAYKARVGEPLDPRNSTRRCSRCGGLNKAPKGAVSTIPAFATDTFCCSIGLQELFLPTYMFTKTVTLFKDRTHKYDGVKVLSKSNGRH
jgi:IS605 OrfB family transposase